MTRIHCIPIFIVLGRVALGGESTQEKGGARPPGRTADRTPGQPTDQAGEKPSSAITVEFSPRLLAGDERTPQGELKALLESTAILKTTRPIRYRSVTLPAGEYSVRIANDEDRGGRNVFFLIGRSAAEPSVPEPVQPPPAPPAGKKAREKSPTKRNEEKANPAKEREGGGGPTEKGPEAKGPKAAPDLIKAIFHLAPAPRASEKVEFSVRQTRRGDRFALMVRAGSSQGKATLRFADVK